MVWHLAACFAVYTEGSLATRSLVAAQQPSAGGIELESLCIQTTLQILLTLSASSSASCSLQKNTAPVYLQSDCTDDVQSLLSHSLLYLALLHSPTHLLPAACKAVSILLALLHRTMGRLFVCGFYRKLGLHAHSHVNATHRESFVRANMLH
jgi:hypothetical protein